MATYTQYDEVGLKEDVSDVITNIAPRKTPFLSSLKTEGTHQLLHQWQEDTLDAAQSNAQIEGADAVDQTLVATVMRSNYMQILSKTIKVSGSADKAKAHGRAKESAYQMGKKAAEAKRDLEKALIGVNQAAVAGNDTTARVMASAYNQIDASNNVNHGVAAALAEADVLTVLGDIYTNGGEVTTLMIKPTDSLIVGGFATATGRTRQFVNDQRKVTNVVNVYVTPYGEVKVVLNRFNLASACLFYAPEYWRLLVFRNWFRQVLAKTGDSTKQQLLGEFSLKHKNFKASGSITGLT